MEQGDHRVSACRCPISSTARTATNFLYVTPSSASPEILSRSRPLRRIDGYWLTVPGGSAARREERNCAPFPSLAWAEAEARGWRRRPGGRERKRKWRRRRPGLAWRRGGGGGGRAGAMAEAGPQAPPPPGTPSRHEKSLGLLTTKFVSLLQEAKDGVLDLKLVRPRAKGWKGAGLLGGPGPGPERESIPGVQLQPLRDGRSPPVCFRAGRQPSAVSFIRRRSLERQALGLQALLLVVLSSGWGIRGSGYSRVHQAIVASLVVALEPRHPPTLSPIKSLGALGCGGVVTLERDTGDTEHPYACPFLSARQLTR